MPSSSSARSTPLIENSLKPSSFTPPVSVTIPTLIASPPPPVSVVVVPTAPPSSSSPPQPAATTERLNAAMTTISHRHMWCLLKGILLFRPVYGGDPRPRAGPGAWLRRVREIALADEHAAGLGALVARDDPAA